MVICSKCGANLRDDARFCAKCGTPCVVKPQPEPLRPETVRAVAVRPATAVKTQATFVNSWLGIVVMGVLFLIAFILLVAGGNLLVPQFWESLLYTVLCGLPIALGVVLSCRAKGIDLSLGVIMGFAATIIATVAENGSDFGGILLAIVLCAVFGLINGVLINYLRIPSPLITLVTGGLLYGLLMVVSGAMPVRHYGGADMFVLLLIVLIVLVPAAFLLVFFTRLGKCRSERKKEDRSFIYVLAYIAAAVMACFAGYFMLVRLGSSNPAIGSGYEVMLIFIAAALRSSRVLDNRFMPIIYAFAAIFVWQLMKFGISILGIDSFVLMIIEALLAGIMLIVAYVCRTDLRKLKN